MEKRLTSPSMLSQNGEIVQIIVSSCEYAHKKRGESFGDSPPCNWHYCPVRPYSE